MLADRYGRFNVVTITNILQFVVVFGIWIPAKTNAVMIVFVIFYGFMSASFNAIVSRRQLKDSHILVLTA